MFAFKKRDEHNQKLLRAARSGLNDKDLHPSISPKDCITKRNILFRRMMDFR